MRLADRTMVLPVVPAEPAVAEQAGAAPIDEVSGLLQIPLVPGFPVQLDKSAFDLWVAADAIDLAWLGAHRVDDEASHLQEPGAARGPVQSDGGLDEMTGAVQLVSPLELNEPFTRKPDLEVGVQVAVRLLRGTE